MNYAFLHASKFWIIKCLLNIIKKIGWKMSKMGDGLYFFGRIFEAVKGPSNYNGLTLL